MTEHDEQFPEDSFITADDLEPEFRHDFERLEKLAGPVDPLGDHVHGGVAPSDDVGTDEEDSLGDSLDLFDPNFFGVNPEDWPVDAVGDEESDRSTLALAQKFSHAEKSYLPFARKREGQQALKRVTVDDFESMEERVAFLAIEKHKIDLFGHKATPATRANAVNWFFAHADHGGLTFDVCAEVLESRPDVVRLRIHYEFWLRWMVFPSEFPFMTVPVPTLIQAEILYHSTDEGLEIAQEAWLQPGLATDDLLTKAAGVDTIDKVPAAYRKALDYLETQYIMSPQHTGWYLTGRNPLLQRLDLEKTHGRSHVGSTVHWSRLFFRPRGT